MLCISKSDKMWYISGPSKRTLEHRFFTNLIKKEFKLSKQRYGSTRIAERQKHKEYRVSRRRVVKL